MRALAVLVALLSVATARAEMDAAEYGVDSVTRSPEAREAISAELALEIAEEALRRRRAAEEQARLLAQAQAAYARRPYAERLLLERCTLCHPAERFLVRRHTWMGWHAVVARMRHLNGAPLTWTEQRVLASELARLRPATAADAWLEYASASFALAAPLLLAGWWRRRRRRERRVSGPRASAPRWCPASDARSPTRCRTTKAP